ncbi:PEP-utilizing enzyme [Arthrobacter sp. R4]
MVMEMGTVVSHGAVVARAYDIPAVVSVADAIIMVRPWHRSDEPN